MRRADGGKINHDRKKNARACQPDGQGDQK
jgi:hypothetical protein